MHRPMQALVADELRSVDTWEARLTKAGQEAATDEEKDKQKAAAWEELIREGKLGYFALLRNLRNIAEQNPGLIPDVCALLTNRQRIKKSLVMPFRFLTALDAIKEADIPKQRSLLAALNQALEISLDNVPKFEGRTLIVLDDSGSMTWGRKTNGRNPIEIGAIFAAVLYKSNEADLMRFSDDASYVTPYFGDAAMSIADGLIQNARSAGTNFHAIFQTAKHAYDRIIILSDMQGWVGTYAPTKEFEEYKHRYQADPFIYSFDLQGYGSLQFPERKVFTLAGFSEKVFDIMQLLETDPKALVNRIEEVQLM